MYYKHLIFRVAVAFTTLTTLAAGPATTLQAASLDLDIRSVSADSVSVPHLQDGAPSSSVQPNPGTPSSQSVRGSNDIVPMMAGTPTPTGSTPAASPGRTAEYGAVVGRPAVVAPDGQPAAAGSLLVTFQSETSNQSRVDANTQAGAVAAEPVG